MGFFDTLLTAIAPERAVKRVAAQTAIRAINSGYSNYGASLHKKSMRGWMWHGGSPKEDIEDNLRVLRERSRDAYMGVPLATGAIKTMRTNVVCGGLTPTPQIDNAFLGISDEEAQKINEQIAREFALWANKPTCDADRIDNFYMLQQLAFTGFLLNGDSWAVLQNKKTPGVPYDLRVRIIEADRICSPAFMDILSPTDINEHHVEKIVQGVETDADGMVIAWPRQSMVTRLVLRSSLLTVRRWMQRRRATNCWMIPKMMQIPAAQTALAVLPRTVSLALARRTRTRPTPKSVRWSRTCSTRRRRAKRWLKKC